MWKPWITAAWEAQNIKQRFLSLEWLEKSWKTLEPYCPGVHMAQIHPHLKWHDRELKSAFQDWLPGLRALKSEYDPNGILPPL